MYMSDAVVCAVMHTCRVRNFCCCVLLFIACVLFGVKCCEVCMTMYVLICICGFQDS